MSSDIWWENLQVFLHPFYINDYAYHLQNLPYGLLWVIRLVLLTTIAVHIWTSIVLTIENAKARPDDYKCKSTAAATYAARTMRVSGVILFLFIVFHIAHYTTRNVPGQEFNTEIVDASGHHYDHMVPHVTPDGHTVKNHYGEDKMVHNTKAMIVAGFSHWWVSAIYIVAMFLLSNHLRHGVSSMFQSLGLRNSGMLPTFTIVAWAYSVVVFLGYIAIPIGVMAKIITA